MVEFDELMHKILQYYRKLTGFCKAGAGIGSRQPRFCAAWGVHNLAGMQTVQ